MGLTHTPEVLREWRKNAEHARDTRSILQDVNGAVVLALLDRIEALETFVQSLHGEKDAAVLNQRVWRFLNPNPGPSRMGDPDPDEEVA